jgi:hypothetical protein
MADLERSHLELRAALRGAGQRIRQLQFGRRNDDPVLVLPRPIYSEGRQAGVRSPSAKFPEQLGPEPP